MSRKAASSTRPPVHPGKTLAAEIAARGLTANALALAIRVSPNRVSKIVNGERAISAGTALRLGRALGIDPLFWVNLQAAYDLAVAEQQDGERIRREVETI